MNPISLIFIILLVALLVGAWPSWGWHAYGYYPSGGVGLVILILLILLLLGKV